MSLTTAIWDLSFSQFSIPSLSPHQIHTFLAVHKHTHIYGSPEHLHGPSAIWHSFPHLIPLTHPTGPSLIGWSCWMLMHTLVPWVSHTQRFPQISAQTFCPPNNPAWIQGLLLPWFSWSLLGTPVLRTYTWFGALRAVGFTHPQIQCVAAEKSFELL